MTRNYLTYLDELELRHPLQTPAYGIPGISQNASVFRVRNDVNLNMSGLGLAQHNKEKSGSISKLTTSTATATPPSAAASMSIKTAWEMEEEDNPLLFDLYPRKFRCSGRIGRGGRLILDRKPIYETIGFGPSSSSLCLSTGLIQNEGSKKSVANVLTASTLNTASHSTTYNNQLRSAMKSASSTTKWIHASSLAPPVHPHRGLGTELLPFIHATSRHNITTTTTSSVQIGNNNDSGSSSNNIGLDGISSSIVTQPVAEVSSSSNSTASTRNNSFPVVVPMSHSLLPPTFMQRERDIFCHSDSEDEAIEYVYPKKLKLTHDSSVKTDIWRDTMHSKYCVSL